MQEESLRMIQSSGDLLLTVVNDVLDFSKLVTSDIHLDIQRTSLQETLSTVVHLIGLKAKPKKVQLRTHYDARVPEFVQTDGYRLQQILYNILGNGINFSQAGGVIELSVTKKAFTPRHPSERTLETEPSTHSFSDSHASDGLPETFDMPIAASGRVISASESLCFTIKDYGKGICKRDFERIFQPFRQAKVEEKNISGGTGLGLAVVSRIVRAMRGRVSVDSEEGEWTEFTVELPLEASMPPEDQGPKIATELKGTIVAVVDTKDSPFEAVLGDLGIEYLRCSELSELEKATQDTIKYSSNCNCCIVLASERLFDHASYHNISSRIPTALLTFGPTYSVKESIGHFMSLEMVRAL